MQYLKIKRRATRSNAAGMPIIEPLIVKKPRKFAPATSEKSLSKTKHILITGGHDSGKSRWVARLHAEAQKIWTRYPAEPLFLDPVRPLAAWSESEQLKGWYESMSDKDESLTPWTKLKAYERQDLIADYLAATKSMLFIDNGHKLSGRKQQIAKDALAACKLSVISTTDEERLPASLRGLVLRRNPQIVRLGTETAYDATTQLIFLITLCSLAVGWWEIAIVTGGFAAIAKGPRATRQD